MASLAVLAACGSVSSTPATLGGGNSPSSQYAKAIAYARCIRSHGVPNFPDPNSNGQFVQTGGNSLNVSNSVISAAQSACQSLAPSGLQISSGQKQQVSAAGLKFAKCMRSHGVPNFPDPPAGGEISLPKGVSPSSPSIQNAERACQSLMPQQGNP
jgi:hypothetical protein